VTRNRPKTLLLPKTNVVSSSAPIDSQHQDTYKLPTTTTAQCHMHTYGRTLRPALLGQLGSQANENSFFSL